MNSKILLAAVLVLVGMLFSQQARAEKDTLRLEPSSPWEIRYEDDGCRLMRRFGKGPEETIIIFSRFGPSAGSRLTFAGNPVRLRRGRQKLNVQFGKFEHEQKIGFSVGKLAEMPALIGFAPVRVAPPTTQERKAIDAWMPGDETLTLPPISSERLAKVKHITIGKPLKRKVILQSESLEKPFAAMEKCIDELLSHWNIDVEKNRTLSKKATLKGNPSNWIQFPYKMQRQGQPALVEFRLSVDKNGAATACHIQQTTRPKEFDDTVCKTLMRKASFEPALDKDGNPIASFWRSTVRFSFR